MHVRGVVESSGGNEMGRSREHGVQPRPGVMQTRARMAALLERKDKKHRRQRIGLGGVAPRTCGSLFNYRCRLMG